MQLVISHIRRRSRHGVLSNVMKKIISLPLSNYVNIRCDSHYEINKSKSVWASCDDAFLKNICSTFARNSIEKVECNTAMQNERKTHLVY